jgi:hypothetical protein
MQAFDASAPCGLNRPVRLLATALATCALIGLSACGSSSTKTVTVKPTILNTENVERAIEASIKRQRKLNSAVSCPVNIEQRKGNDFSCFATVKGKRSEFVVTQTDDDGHVTYRGV